MADSDVLKCIRMLTFLPLEQIDEMDKWEGAKLNEAKEILAYELTKLVHGEEEAKKAKEASHALFAWLPGAAGELLGSIPILQVGVPAVLSVYFDLFSSFMQAFIFCMLTTLYIANAADDS